MREANDVVQKVITERFDDLDGSPAVETVRFGYAGREYEIDLNEEHASALDEALATYIEHVREGTQRVPRKPRMGLPLLAPATRYLWVCVVQRHQVVRGDDMDVGRGSRSTVGQPAAGGVLVDGEDADHGRVEVEGFGSRLGEAGGLEQVSDPAGGVERGVPRGSWAAGLG